MPQAAIRMTSNRAARRHVPHGKLRRTVSAHPVQTPRRHYSHAALGIVTHPPPGMGWNAALDTHRADRPAPCAPDSIRALRRRQPQPPGLERPAHSLRAKPPAPVHRPFQKARYSFHAARPHPPTDATGPAPGAALPPEPGRPGMPSVRRSEQDKGGQGDRG